jgi:hypothetical protein
VVAAILENFGYRQILAVWQVSGALNAWRGRTAVWGSMHREGFDAHERDAEPVGVHTP